MATLKELEMLMRGIPGVSEETVSLIIGEMQRSLPGERINIPASRVSKKEQILTASKKLPASVVAARYGVTHSYVCRAIKRRKN